MSSHFRTLIVVIAFLCSFCRTLADEVEFHFVDVGQGDCTLVKTPNGKTVLIDCGSTGGGDVEDVRDYLREQLNDDRVVDVLVVTHPDKDHYNFLPRVLAGTTVRRVLYVGTLDEYPHGNFEQWLTSHPNRERLQSNQFDPSATPSSHFDTGDVKFHVLAAETAATESPVNARSIVLRVSYRNFDAILTGDATFDTENKILARYTPQFLDVELLKIGHHGSSTTSTSAPWLQALRPEIAVVSAGYNSQYEHPRKSVVDAVANFTVDAAAHPFRWGLVWGGHMRLRNVTAYTEAVYSTASNGNLVLTSDGTTWEIAHNDGINAFPANRPRPKDDDSRRRFALAPRDKLDVVAVPSAVADGPPVLTSPPTAPANTGRSTDETSQEVSVPADRPRPGQDGKSTISANADTVRLMQELVAEQNKRIDRVIEKLAECASSKEGTSGATSTSWHDIAQWLVILVVTAVYPVVAKRYGIDSQLLDFLLRFPEKLRKQPEPSEASRPGKSD